MTEPFFSCICLTAGRANLLEESIACFLHQDFKGESELIVLNTLPAQQLELATPSPRIRIINLQTRPPSLGAARNIAIEQAHGNWIVTHDDDDLYLPNHLSNYAPHTGGNDWIWLDRQFYMLRSQIKSIVQGSANVFAFTKAAWEKAGRYKEMNCGEDRDIVGRISATCKGTRIHLDDYQVSFIYAWGNGAYHQSGLGDDRPGRLNSWARAERVLQQRLAQRAIPKGVVKLTPKLRHDYMSQARRFWRQPVRSEQPVPAQNQPVPPQEQQVPLPTTPTATRPVGVVLLGRFGDIINLLPVLKHIADNYARPYLVVSREFAQILEGISYVEPFVVDLPNDKLRTAINTCRGTFKHLLVAQAWSTDMPQERKTEAYNKESWAKAGFGHKFDDPNMLPRFDVRNLQREDALCKKIASADKPWLLVKLGGSISSPFPKGPTLFEPIQKHFGDKFNVVNLMHFKAERIFDLLGLFDRAKALISVDTSLLHLAAASSIPHVALVNPQPWLGTLPRGNCVARMTYSEAVSDPGRVIASIEKAIAAPRPEILPVLSRQPPKRRLFHCVERHEQPHDRRKSEAWQSWKTLYSAGVIASHVANYPRTATSIGDRRQLPFLKDVLAVTMQQADDDDLIIFTNDDVVLHPDLPELTIFHAAVYGPFSSQRCEFKKQHMPTLGKPPAHFALMGGKHMGRDLFCFTKLWLATHWDQIPDFILGASVWDLCIACMIRLNYGIKSDRQNLASVISPAEIERGYVAHEIHQAHWCQPQNVNSPSEKWNKRQFKEWAGKHLPSLPFTANNSI